MTTCFGILMPPEVNTGWSTNKSRCRSCFTVGAMCIKGNSHPRFVSMRCLDVNVLPLLAWEVIRWQLQAFYLLFQELLDHIHPRFVLSVTLDSASCSMYIAFAKRHWLPRFLLFVESMKIFALTVWSGNIAAAKTPFDGWQGVTE